MKMLLFVAAAMSFMAPAAAAERTYSVTDFDQIQIDGGYEVTLTTGGPSRARATGSPQALDRVLIDVQGRTLRIRPNRVAWGAAPGAEAGPVRIEASTRILQSAAVRGSGRLSVDRARAPRLTLSLSGSATLNLGNVETDHLVIGLIGSGTLSVAGKAKQLRATIQGSGDLDASGLKADDADITASTAGTVSVAAVRTAKVRSSGTGDVAILGAPACTVSAQGAGLVRCGNGR